MASTNPLPKDSPVWPETAPVERSGGGNSGDMLALYTRWMKTDVETELHRPASEHQLQLILTYVEKYGYVDVQAYNWLMDTFVYTGVVG